MLLVTSATGERLLLQMVDSMAERSREKSKWPPSLLALNVVDVLYRECLYGSSSQSTAYFSCCSCESLDGRSSLTRWRQSNITTLPSKTERDGAFCVLSSAARGDRCRRSAAGSVNEPQLEAKGREGRRAITQLVDRLREDSKKEGEKERMPMAKRWMNIHEWLLMLRQQRKQRWCCCPSEDCLAEVIQIKKKVHTFNLYV